MNLIEQLGGYEKAKEWDENRTVGSITADAYHDLLALEFYQYKRAKNIFEVGDLVIDTNYKDSDIQEIKSVNGNRIEVFHKNKAYYFATYIFSFRHATDAEIAAGHRL